MTDDTPELRILVEAERAARQDLNERGRQPDYPQYKSGLIIAAGTISAHGFHRYTDE